MKRFLLSSVLAFVILSAGGQPEAVRNVIVMIPDGTSTGLLSAARWYRQYHGTDAAALNIDPYICGLIRTHSSDAPVGDSAPTTSCYMTGQPSQTGFVATYPVKTDHDLVAVDTACAYRPLATLPEAARQMQHKAVGLVFTCEFPHATPADCAAHSADRGNYGMIAPQMVHNQIDVVIGGGNSCLSDADRAFLTDRGFRVFADDYASMKACRSGRMWALFGPLSMPYEMERDTATTPSLAEMTAKAIELLAQNENGFFLMVEGSKIDWAAHDNDAKAAITDMLAFDDACGVALDFAKKNGETAVIVVPDHGTGGLNIGSARSNKGYDTLSLPTIMGPLTPYRLSTWTMSEKLKAADAGDWPALFGKYCGFTPDKAEIDYLMSASDCKSTDIPYEQRKDNLSLSKMLGQVLYGRTCIGFTTYGHTGENVFLACYHPENDIPVGCITNVRLHEYLCRLMGLTDSLPKLTGDIYADHHKVFARCEMMRIDSLSPDSYRLTVRNGKNTLTAESSSNAFAVNGKRHELNSVIVYMPDNRTFYLPKRLAGFL